MERTRKKGNRRLRKLSTIVVLFVVALTAMICGAMLYANGSERKYGDVNMDEKVDISDAVLLARYCAADRTVRITLDGLNNADVNLDGFVTTDDLVTLLRQIAHMIPMTTDPSATTTLPVETTTETLLTTTSTESAAGTSGTENTGAETTTESSTVQSSAETTTTEETTTTTSTAANSMTADTETLPIGVSLSVLTGQQQPDEQLTVNYQIGNIIFSVYVQQPEKTTIAITHQDTIVGYYRICRSYTVPEGYLVKEFCDEKSGTSDNLYAVLVLKDGVSINFAQVVNQSEISVLSKLNFHATNGIRAAYGSRLLMWDDQAARAALSHSQEMADLDYFEHTSYDGTKMSDRLLQFDIDWQSCGENVEYGMADPFSAVDIWFNSDKGHRETMLENKYTRVGIGFASGDIHPGRFYGTQDYWRGWDD